MTASHTLSLAIKLLHRPTDKARRPDIPSSAAGQHALTLLTPHTKREGFYTDASSTCSTSRASKFTMKTTSSFLKAPSPTVLVSVLLLLLQSAHFTHAHGGHGHDAHLIESPENQSAPIDTLLRLHIIFETLTWGFIFPIGMILGLSRSRYHVPLQVTTTLISIAGMQLARNHGGRQFSHANHGNFAPWLLWLMLVQGGIGIYLKMHIMEGTNVRWATVKIHGILGRLFPVVGYTQMVLGVILGLASILLSLTGSGRHRLSELADRALLCSSEHLWRQSSG